MVLSRDGLLRDVCGVCLVLAIQSASALACALIHPSARHSASERAAHGAFISEKLSFSAAALAGAPFFLVYRGAPTLVETAVFTLALLQMAAAMIVARSGHLRAGHFIAIASFGGIAATFGLGVAGGLVACFAWLILAGVEALSSLDRRTNEIASVVIVAVLGLTIVVAPTITPPATSGIFMACVAVIGVLVIARRITTVLAVGTTTAAYERGRSQALAKTLDGPVIGFDRDGLVDHVTSHCEDMLGVGPGDLDGRGLFEHVHVADRPAFLKLVADAAHQPGIQIGRLRLRSGTAHVNAAGQPEPRHIEVEMRAHRIATDRCEPGDSATGVVARVSEVPAVAPQTGDIDDAQQSVEAATRSRDEFLANMSHELRTPLNAIIGFSEMLASQTIRPVEESKQREYARIIHQSGQHLLSVVNSILDMSKIQSGTFALFPEPFEVAQLVDQCCDMMRLKAESGRVEMIRDMPDSIADVLGDRRACKQILINLLSNAVKFTPEHGRVTIRLRPEGTSLCITVADTGIGIGKADLSRLGDPFFQARSSISRPYEGTGLGLSVVRGLIDLHGGSLAIDSELGTGTTVTVRLPFDRRVAGREGRPLDRDVASTYAIADRRRAPETGSPAETDRSTEPRMKQIA